MGAEPTLRPDVAILGGGVAGLWLLDALRRAGYRALLAETAALGDGQTIAAQGILHGGIKYALAGAPSAAARAVRDMPDRWFRSLRGAEEPDLSGVRLRARDCLLWGSGTLRGRAGLLGARAFLRAAPRTLPDAERPDALEGVPGPVLSVPEPVLSPASLLECLARRCDGLLLRASGGIDPALESKDPVIRLREDGRSLVLRPGTLVLAAGAGADALRSQLGLPTGAMQRRPLHVPLLRGTLPDLNGHAIDGAVVRLTVTTDRDRTGRAVWQLGGAITEAGVPLDPPALLRRARAEIEALLPGIPLAGVEWTTFRVDRAEGAAGGAMPGDVTVLREGPVLTAWPTKLVLAPRLADEIRSRLHPPGDGPPTDLWRREVAAAAWPAPDVALPPWDRPGLPWTDAR